MEVILIKDMENLGYANDIVNVKPGYANNYLIPQGYAKAATASRYGPGRGAGRQRHHRRPQADQRRADQDRGRVRGCGPSAQGGQGYDQVLGRCCRIGPRTIHTTKREISRWKSPFFMSGPNGRSPTDSIRRPGYRSRPGFPGITPSASRPQYHIFQLSRA